MSNVIHRRVPGDRAFQADENRPVVPAVRGISSAEKLPVAVGIVRNVENRGTGLDLVQMNAPVFRAKGR